MIKRPFFTAALLSTVCLSQLGGSCESDGGGYDKDHYSDKGHYSGGQYSDRYPQSYPPPPPPPGQYHDDYPEYDRPNRIPRWSDSPL